MKFTLDDVRKIAKDTVNDVDTNAITEESRLNDVFDSLTLMDVLLNLEEKYAVDTSEVQITGQCTFKDLIGFFS